LVRSESQLLFDEYAIRTPRNGVRTITSRRLAIRDQDGEPRYLLGVIEDMTERKAIERQLQQAQKMETVGNLTGGLAHDFNNLLLIIIGNVDLLKLDILGNTPAEEKVETILEASLRGAELTRQMLAFSRRQALHPKRLDVNGLIGKTMRMLMRALGESITYDLQLGSGVWQVVVDEAQLEAALVNIAINARDAMPQGGSLRLATANAHVDAELAARHAEFTPGDYVMIEITDTGTGMPPEVVARIFEPFFSTKAPGKGTGLGLSMVYGFIKQSKGHISAYSEVGLGTTFKIYLPRDATGEVQPAEQTASHGPIPRAKDGEVILAVDDNPGVRAAVCTQLKELGYQVHQANSGQAALDRLDSVKVDLLFTDVVMPGGMNGKELAEQARAKFPDLKVLFTSGFPGKSGTHDIELDAGDRLLSKPYRKDDLAQAVRDVLDDSSRP
jgi:signal transduction histidine kinase/ActR/RegA family two-component response regulator